MSESASFNNLVDGFGGFGGFQRIGENHKAEEVIRRRPFILAFDKGQDPSECNGFSRRQPSLLKGPGIFSRPSGIYVSRNQLR